MFFENSIPFACMCICMVSVDEKIRYNCIFSEWIDIFPSAMFLNFVILLNKLDKLCMSGTPASKLFIFFLCFWKLLNHWCCYDINSENKGWTQGLNGYSAKEKNVIWLRREKRMLVMAWHPMMKWDPFLLNFLPVASFTFFICITMQY